MLLISFFIIFHHLTIVQLQVLFCGLTKGITPKICRLCFCLNIYKWYSVLLNFLCIWITFMCSLFVSLQLQKCVAVVYIGLFGSVKNQWWSSPARKILKQYFNSLLWIWWLLQFAKTSKSIKTKSLYERFISVLLWHSLCYSHPKLTNPYFCRALCSSHINQNHLLMLEMFILNAPLANNMVQESSIWVWFLGSVETVTTSHTVVDLSLIHISEPTRRA